jgi:starch synthase
MSKVDTETRSGSKPDAKTKTRTKTRTKTKTKTSRPLRVLMVAAEAAPYAKVGGLGDVAGTLPRRLVELGMEVAVVLPCYRDVIGHGHEPRPTGRQVVLFHAGVRRSSPVLELISEGVRYWFIKEDQLYDREGVYGPPGGEYPDSAVRFSYLSRAAVEAGKVMSFAPDIVHCHDWHTALTFFYMGQAGMNGIRKFLTIHNLAYQGVFDQRVFNSLDLPQGVEARALLDHMGSLNFLKAGIESADILTTVSPTYAVEIQSSDLGCGLEDILRRRKDILTGVLNGIDFDEWDPGRDRSLAAPFTAGNITGRRINRDALFDELGLDADPKSPVMAFVGRLVHQKGADVLAAAMPRIVAKDFRFIVLGTGDPVLEGSLQALSRSLRGRVSVNIGFDEKLARKIYAGSDFFLMPSRFEPCGLGQMIAMRYGAVPIVRDTGGLRDTVVDLDGNGEGNGLVFKEVNERDLLDVIQRALEFYKNGHMDEIIPRIMALDNSWKRSAKRYEQLYKGLTARERE